LEAYSHPGCGHDAGWDAARRNARKRNKCKMM